MLLAYEVKASGMTQLLTSTMTSFNCPRIRIHQLNLAVPELPGSEMLYQSATLLGVMLQARCCLPIFRHVDRCLGLLQDDALQYPKV